jgi:hypothetical protein
VVRDSSLHRRSDAQRLVDAAEIKEGHVQMNSGGQVFQGFAESKAQARKAAKVRPHAEVGPLDMGSADTFQLGVSVVLALEAGHIGFSLVFLREKPDNHDLGSRCGLRPRLDSASPLAETSGEAFFFLSQRTNSSGVVTPAKSKRPSCISTNYFALYAKALKNRIKESQRISYASKVISPTCECVPNLYGTHWLASRLIDYGPHKIGPRDFRLYVLAKSVLETDFGGLQLSKFRIELVALLCLVSDLRSYNCEGFLEVLCHGYS